MYADRVKNRALKAIYIYNGIFVFAGSLLGPLYAVYVGLIDRDILAISFTWTAFLLSTVAFTFIISRVGDGVREKEYLMIGGFAVRAVVWYLYIFVASIPQLILLQIFLGFGEALGTPSFKAIFAEHLDKGKQIKEYADWELVARTVTGGGTLAGGFVASKFGFPWLFASMSILAVVAFIGILFQPRKLL